MVNDSTQTIIHSNFDEGGGKEEKKPDKKNQATSKSVKRKRKGGAPAVVKIPQGKILITTPGMC